MSKASQDMSEACPSFKKEKEKSVAHGHMSGACQSEFVFNTCPTRIRGHLGRVCAS